MEDSSSYLRNNSLFRALRQLRENSVDEVANQNANGVADGAADEVANQDANGVADGAAVDVNNPDNVGNIPANGANNNRTRRRRRTPRVTEYRTKKLNNRPINIKKLVRGPNTFVNIINRTTRTNRGVKIRRVYFPYVKDNVTDEYVVFRNYPIYNDDLNIEEKINNMPTNINYIIENNIPQFDRNQGILNGYQRFHRLFGNRREVFQEYAFKTKAGNFYEDFVKKTNGVIVSKKKSDREKVQMPLMKCGYGFQVGTWKNRGALIDGAVRKNVEKRYGKCRSGSYRQPVEGDILMRPQDLAYLQAKNPLYHNPETINESDNFSPFRLRSIPVGYNKKAYIPKRTRKINKEIRRNQPRQQNSSENTEDANNRRNRAQQRREQRQQQQNNSNDPDFTVDDSGSLRDFANRTSSEHQEEDNYAIRPNNITNSQRNQMGNDNRDEEDMDEEDLQEDVRDVFQQLEEEENNRRTLPTNRRNRQESVNSNEPELTEFANEEATNSLRGNNLTRSLETENIREVFDRNNTGEENNDGNNSLLSARDNNPSLDINLGQNELFRLNDLENERVSPPSNNPNSNLNLNPNLPRISSRLLARSINNNNKQKKKGGKKTQKHFQKQCMVSKRKQFTKKKKNKNKNATKKTQMNKRKRNK